MRKILALTAVYLLTLSTSVYFRSKKEFNSKAINYFESAIENENETVSVNESDGPMEFLKFHQGIRTRQGEEKPSYPVNYQWKELAKAKQFASVKKSSINARTESVSNGVISFTERGPGNIAGRTRGLIVDPDDATHKTWFTGSASGGIWKTTDAGTSWQWLTPNISNMSTTCLAMAASNHNTIYAGTGEGFGLIDGVTGVGVFKSTDRGVTWNLLTSSEVMANVNRLAVDPSNENHVLAACNAGIYQSTDGGNTWNQVYTGVVQDLKPNPSNFSILYAAENSVGVLKSTDGGTTWNKSNKSMAPKGRVEIGISPVNPNQIVASAEGTLSGSNSDLYLSTDGGATWNLVLLNLNSKIVDWLSTQGWYDNTVAFSPFNQNVLYVGGVNMFQVTIGSLLSSSTGTYSITDNAPFMSLVSFTNATTGFASNVQSGSAANQTNVQVIFGSGISQKAHRFLVPVDSTSGVHNSSYTYQDYVDVPFQVWNTATNQQLMVSFRDQDRNGVFDLIAENETSTDATQQSREYIFINNVPYDPSGPNSSIAQTGGHVYQEMYFFWPVLASGATWDPTSLPTSNVQITYSSINQYSSTVKTAADAYNSYNSINNYTVVHPDHHNIYPIIQNAISGTYQLLVGCDGGVFVTGTSASPGTTQGDWNKVGYGYNTSQFYGADKKPGGQQYLGGMQDNSTYFTPSTANASASTYYITNPQLSGDGFEVLWHSLNGNKMIGGTYQNQFSKSIDGGTTWTPAITGFPLVSGSPDPSKFPFISKLACSKQSPDNIFSVGSQGVWKSSDFGSNWTLVPITTGWNFASFTDIEVSRANANYVWAGSGQYSGTFLFVSTDGGNTFNPTTNPSGYTLGNITRIATHPLDQNTAYAIYSASNYAKILKTTDLGQTWTDISGFGTGGSGSSTGFPDVAVYSLYVRPDNPNIIWAGTEIGIVESLDGGASWAMSTEFPNVPVWDMKGQDDEIVIATHGRGIWTAEVGVDQNLVSKILNTGTSPQAEFVTVVNVPSAYDSVQIKVNSKVASFAPPDTGTYVVRISNAPTGGVTVQTISYREGNPTYSAIISATNLPVTPAQTKFFDYINSGNNFYLNGFQVQSFTNGNTTLQTPHNYPNNQSEYATLLVPIIVSSSLSNFVYSDIAIVQPGASGSVFGQAAFNDYVIPEATTDGLNWTPIANGYNSSANSNWLSTYNSKQAGTSDLTVVETFDLKNNFKANDTLLIRFRLTSNSDNIVAWGWSVDNLFIQMTPTGIEPVTEEVTVYPNPSSGSFNINYYLPHQSDVFMNVWDVTGRPIVSQNFGNQNAGDNQASLNLETSPTGIYIIKLKTNTFEKILKVVINR